MKEQPIKVKYENKEYWFLQQEDGSGAVAPLEHCYENGELDFRKAFKSETFAHVNAERKMHRFGEYLGQIDEFIV